MVKEESIGEREKVSSSYSSRKGLVWEQLNSNQDDWQPAEIKGYIFVDGKGDMPVYHIGSVEKVLVSEDSNGKSYNIIYHEDKKDYTAVKTLHKMGCNLCGAMIMNIHYIINYKTKEYMEVGSECVNHHHGQVVRKKIKEFVMNDLRKKFVELREKTIALLDTYVDIDPKNKEQLNAWYIKCKRLEFWAYELKIKLEKIVPNEAGQRLLKNRIKDMEELLKTKQSKDISWFKPKNYISSIKELIENEDETAILTFGKYKDMQIKDVPQTYIDWAKGQ